MSSKVKIGENLLTQFSIFLIGRFLNVKAGNVRSVYTKIDSGVSQGTIRGPLMFILLVNIASAVLSTSLYSRVNSIEENLIFETDISAPLVHVVALKTNFEECVIQNIDGNSLELQCTVNGNRNSAARKKLSPKSPPVVFLHLGSIKSISHQT